MEFLCVDVLDEKIAMGEITITGSEKKGNGKPKRRKLSTRVDLTPMVDLGFLLITFFIFTTSMSEPTSMKLILPDDTPVSDPIETPEGSTLTMLIAKGDRIAYYHGKDVDALQYSGSSPAQIRNVINATKQRIVETIGHAKDYMIIIKPTSEATYETIINVLDELKINGVSKYALVEPDESELQRLH